MTRMAGGGLLVEVPAVAAHAGAPPPPALAVTGGRVVAIGPVDRCRHALAAAGVTGPEVLRAPAGAVVLPGFVDPHVHLLSMAAARCSVDLAPAGNRTALLDRLAAAPAGGWVRAVGWDDALGHGPLTAADLDRACPSRPVVVHHATGHLAALSTEALARLSVEDHGDGVVPGNHPALARVPRLGPAVLDHALAAVGRELSAAGVVAVTDATATNGAAEVDRLAGGDLPVRVEAMAGVHAIGHVPDGTRIKLVVEDSTVTTELADQIALAHRCGHPVALHVVDVGPLQVALDALAAAPGPPPGCRDRLEHVSLCLPEQVDGIARSGVAVVNQPSFLLHRGAKYRSELSEVEQRWLYRTASLLRAGVEVSASSDAPVVPARPLESVQAMVTRDDPAERVDLDVALDLVTRRAAAVSATGSPGVLTVGGPADFVVLGADPRRVRCDELAAIPVLGTWVGGQPALESAPGSGSG
jgi:predicted amidohydrolase YtcJ